MNIGADMKRLISITALAVLIVSAVPSAQGADAALVKLLQQYEAALNQSDTKAFAALHTPDSLRLMTGGVLLAGRTAIEQRFAAESAGAGKGQKVTIRPGETRMLSADVALLSGEYEASGGEAPIKGRYLLTAKREGGQWLVAGLASSRDPSPK
jgi:uncharacterized protein (TIGR02246 family)